ncbi:MAG: glycosyltransferase family 2 protein [Anaerolineales bacterium]
MPDPEPLVSIITPSYNQAQFLETTLRSVLEQDYPHIEYIVIDGGSTDGSVEILERYSDQLAYWESESDRGQADAINKGFKRATGEIVAWLNSDDVYTMGAIQQAVEALESNPEAGMVYGDGLMVDEDLRLLDPHTYPPLSVVDLLSFEVLLQPAVFMRRHALEQVGYLNDDFNLILDHELWVRMASQFPIVHVPSFWALERTHGEAKTIALAGEFVTEAKQLLAWAQESDDLGETVQEHQNRILAGYHVFAARRLIDAEAFSVAVRHLGKAMQYHPPTLLRYWYKAVQAGFSALGLSEAFMTYRRLRRRLQFGDVSVDPFSPLGEQPDLTRKIGKAAKQ